MPASILSVEDDDGMALLLRLAFEESCADIPLHRVSNVTQAMEFLKGGGGSRRPTLILVDINLPAIDGFEFLHRLKTGEHTREIPVVVFTASVRKADEQRCLELGASRFCRKGNSFEEIVAVVKELCEFAEERAA